ncbi:peptidoglycan recognition protein family protein, partial [Streptomyces natalensis]
MTATIAYDRPVSNLIDQLSATGHVTHTPYRKTSVTLHHNDGNVSRLSHQGVLNGWKTRKASAHFDVDAAGAVAQYVKVNEYAWAVGNKAGNQSSISIEMANATLGPNWTVAEATWKNAARLAGWNFAKVIGERPSKSNLFYHHHWTSTVCAGPYMNKIYDQVLAAAQEAYDHFKDSHPTPGPDTEPFPGASYFHTGQKSPI